MIRYSSANGMRQRIRFHARTRRRSWCGRSSESSHQGRSSSGSKSARPKARTTDRPHGKEIRRSHGATSQEGSHTKEATRWRGKSRIVGSRDQPGFASTRMATEEDVKNAEGSRSDSASLRSTCKCAARTSKTAEVARHHYHGIGIAAVEARDGARIVETSRGRRTAENRTGFMIRLALTGMVSSLGFCLPFLGVVVWDLQSQPHQRHRRRRRPTWACR